jgi:transcriptional regulator with XRE-family HTH domain
MVDGKVKEEYKKVGERIRKFRIQKGMTQADLSEKANIGLSHISDIELGKTKMMLVTFTRIAEALQISTDVLIRPDIPEVNNLYQNEFAEILGDCTPDEIDSIIKIVKELKATMHSNKNMYDK